jgi:hypothetical protein
MRAIFDKTNDSCAKYQTNRTFSSYDIILLFKGRVIFGQYIPKKPKWFGLKLYKLCYSKGITYNMTVYLGRDRKGATPSMTATCATVAGLAARIKHIGHKLEMDSFFSSTVLFDDLHTKTINCCGPVGPNRKGKRKNFGYRMRLKKDDLKTWVKGILTAIVWKDK